MDENNHENQKMHRQDACVNQKHTMLFIPIQELSSYSTEVHNPLGIGEINKNMLSLCQQYEFISKENTDTNVISILLDKLSKSIHEKDKKVKLSNFKDEIDNFINKLKFILENARKNKVMNLWDIIAYYPLYIFIILSEENKDYIASTELLLDVRQCGLIKIQNLDNKTIINLNFKFFDILQKQEQKENLEFKNFYNESFLIFTGHLYYLIGKDERSRKKSLNNFLRSLFKGNTTDEIIENAKQSLMSLNPQLRLNTLYIIVVLYLYILNINLQSKNIDFEKVLFQLLNDMKDLSFDSILFPYRSPFMNGLKIRLEMLLLEKEEYKTPDKLSILLLTIIDDATNMITSYNIPLSNDVHLGRDVSNIVELSDKISGLIKSTFMIIPENKKIEIKNKLTNLIIISKPKFSSEQYEQSIEIMEDKIKNQFRKVYKSLVEFYNKIRLNLYDIVGDLDINDEPVTKPF